MSRLSRLFRGGWRHDLDDEIQEHLRETAEELIQRGMDPGEASREARRRFGNAARLAEDARAEWSLPWLESLWHDVRHAARALRRDPAFALVAILSLTLGIAANTVVFTVVDHVLLRPLPYAHAGRLLALSSRNPGQAEESSPVSAADFDDWQRAGRSFDSMAAYASWPVNLTNVAEPMRLNGELVSPGFFDTIGVAPAIGRSFLPDEDQPRKDAVAVLSHRLASQLGSPAEMVGSTITLNRSPATVIGVMPPGFRFLGRETDVWLPLSLSPANRANRESRWLRVVGRLAPGTTANAARREFSAIADRLAAAYPETDKSWGVSLAPLRDELVAGVRSRMLVAQAAVALLLLITCINLANLLLARGSGRAREMAVRAALGAGRARIVRQLAIESKLPAAIGGAAGTLLAYAALGAVRRFGAGMIPRVEEIAPDARLILFALLATALTALLFGALPALHTGRFDLRRHVYSGRATAHGAEGRRSLLVSAELALVSVLLVGASLLGESLVHLYRTDPGFRVDHLLTMRLTLSRSRYPDAARQSAFFRQALDRVRELPGVVAAGAVSDAPLSGNEMSAKFVLETDTAPLRFGIRFFTSGYLRAAGIPLLEGRDAGASDEAAGRPVALVSRAVARRCWPGAEAPGKRLRLAEGGPWLTVAGVVGDTPQVGLSAGESAAVYILYNQKPWDMVSWTTLAVRTSRDPAGYANDVRRAIFAVDKDQPVADVATMEQTLARSLAAPRFTLWMVGAVTFLALGIALIGVSGVVAYVVAQRTPEIAIRMALGAAPRQVFGMLLRQALARAAAGIAAGLAGAWALAGLLRNLLFGVAADDPRVFATVAAFLAAAALAAAVLPARRARHIDPARALREGS